MNTGLAPFRYNADGSLNTTDQRLAMTDDGRMTMPNSNYDPSANTYKPVKTDNWGDGATQQQDRPFQIINGVRHYGTSTVGLGGPTAPAEPTAPQVGLGGPTVPTPPAQPTTESQPTLENELPNGWTYDENGGINVGRDLMITRYEDTRDLNVPTSPPGGYTPPSALPNASTGGTGYNENTDVSLIAADIMDRDSPLMRLAEARGMQAANRRGLMNSSIAVNSAQDAVLDQVVPMASQEAGQRFQSNRANQDYTLSSLLSGQDYQQQRGLNEQGFGFDRALAEQAYGFERGLNEQNYGFERGLNEQNFGFDIGRMDRDNELAIGRDNNAFANERTLEEIRIEAGRDEAALDREFEREMTGIDWDGRFGLAELDGDIRRDLMDREEDMRVRVTRLETELEAKNVSMDAFFTARNQYNSRVDQIMANPDLSAEERESQLQTALDYLDVDLQGVEDMYAIDLPWTDYEPEPAPVDATQVRSDLEQIYEEVLGRDPDMSGINGYEQAVLSGQMTIDEVREEIRNSPEGTGQVQATRNNITQLYRDTLGEEPDQAGLDFWSEQVLNGTVTEAQVRGFLAGELRFDNDTGQIVPA